MDKHWAHRPRFVRVFVELGFLSRVGVRLMEEVIGGVRLKNRPAMAIAERVRRLLDCVERCSENESRGGESLFVAFAGTALCH